MFTDGIGEMLRNNTRARGEYFEKYANMHSVIVCWISLAGVEFVLKAWIYLF